MSAESRTPECDALMASFAEHAHADYKICKIHELAFDLETRCGDAVAALVLFVTDSRFSPSHRMDIAHKIIAYHERFVRKAAEAAK